MVCSTQRAVWVKLACDVEKLDTPCGKRQHAVQRKTVRCVELAVVR